MFIGDAKTHMNRLTAKRNSRQGDGAMANTEKLLPFYVRMMTKLTDCERCSVFINDPVKDQVWLKAGTGVDEREIEVPKEGSVVGDVIASGESIVINDLEARTGAHKHSDTLTGFTTRNILCVPIKSAANNEISGAFQLLNKTGGQEFSNEDKSLAEEISDHLQAEVDAIYLDQEIFGLTENLYSTVGRVTKYFLASTVLAVAAIVVFLGVWMNAPSLMG